jgi:hypothetical protein
MGVRCAIHKRVPLLPVSLSTPRLLLYSFFFRKTEEDRERVSPGVVCMAGMGVAAEFLLAAGLPCMLDSGES